MFRAITKEAIVKIKQKKNKAGKSEPDKLKKIGRLVVILVKRGREHGQLVQKATAEALTRVREDGLL